jgi:5-(aminomethyl)-3-furanmethanol phosphate kinase
MVEPVVVKVGGSLLVGPELRPRLTAWLNELPTSRVVLVPGGGAAADVVRELDRVHGLGEEAAHWLAIRAMTMNAHVLAALLPRARVVAQLAELAAAWSAHVVPVLDCLPMLLDDERHLDKLPHTWAVTSDAIAARVAEVLHAQLVLLKSVSLAGKHGLVDAVFPTIVHRGNLKATVVNLWSGEVSTDSFAGLRVNDPLRRSGNL